MSDDRNPEHLVQWGCQLITLGRWMQRTFPHVGTPGAQHGEDQFIAELLEGRTGSYVDIGASHPVECSNTWRFYQQGWRGLLVEPLPEAWHALLRDRPGDLLCPTAVANYTGFGRMRVCRTVTSMRPDWISDETGVFWAEVDTLSNIVNRYPEIRDTCRLCSIDVEGMEREVLLGNNWSRFRPEVFCVEWAIHGKPAPDNDSSPQWADILYAHGYRLIVRTACNLIFTRLPCSTTAPSPCETLASKDALETNSSSTPSCEPTPPSTTANSNSPAGSDATSSDTTTPT